jgi:hypothetical protein
MPIVLGLASSHAPSMFCTAEQWPTVHKGLTRTVPQPPQIAAETPEILQDYVRRIGLGFKALRAELEAARPDAVVIVGDDQNEVFSGACIPQFAISLGAEASGTTSITWVGQNPEDNHITLKGHPEIARLVLEGLIERNFDPASIETLTPLARPAGGLGHAFTRIGKAMGLAESGIPAVIVFLNAYHPPMPGAERCYAFGKALADVFAGRPERIALYGSGGLSHCPLGPRAGWVDEALDRWVLSRITEGRGAELQNLFKFDSETLRSGTGEIRGWVTVAGAFDGAKATVVDYIPAYHAVTGLGFAHWKPDA